MSGLGCQEGQPGWLPREVARGVRQIDRVCMNASWLTVLSFAKSQILRWRQYPVVSQGLSPGTGEKETGVPVAHKPSGAGIPAPRVEP